MRHRLLASVTAGALVLSSLVLGTYVAQADGPSSTVVVQSDDATGVDETPSAATTPAPVLPEDDATPADDVTPGEDSTVSPSAESTGTPSPQSGSATPIAAPVPADDTIPTDDQTDATVTITGKITPTGLANTWGYVCQVQSANNDCQWISPADDGSYSAEVAPGSSVYVMAKADGYLYTWVGGLTSTSSSLNTYDSSTVMTAPESGTWTVDDIVLQKAGSISGKVILPQGYSFTGDDMGSMYAYLDGTSNNWSIYTQITTEGTYAFTGLNPGDSYRITVNAEDMGVAPSNDFVDTDYPGVATATVAGTTGVNITLTAGALIQGTITPANAQVNNIQACQVTGSSGDSYRDTNNCTSGTYSNGSYSVPVSPGATVVVYASASGYLPTYVGGYADSFTANNVVNDAITLIPTSSQGGIVSGQNIALKQAGSISGSVVLPAGYTYSSDQYSYMDVAQVGAYPVDRSSDTPYVSTYYAVTTWIPYYNGSGSTATYSITNLVPGREYIVQVDSTSLVIDQPNNLLPTYAGGYTSTAGVSSSDLNQSDVRLVVPTVAGVTDVNITMKKGDGISGTITPADASYKQVWVCEIAVNDNYTNMTNCQTPRVNSDGTYSVGVTSGANVVIQAKATNYLYTWLGGYTGINEDTYRSLQDGMKQVTAPATGQNINLSPAAILSGTLSLPAGYKLSYGYVNVAEVVQGDNGLTLGDWKAVQISSDGRYRFEVEPGAKYILVAEPGSQILSQGNNSDLLTAVAGGYQTESYISNNIDLSDSSISKIAMTSDKTVNLTMTAGAKITGTVYMPDGTPLNFGNSSNGYAYVTCISASSFTNTRSNYQSTSSSVASDGSYSCTVVPGRAYIVNAYAYTYTDTDFHRYQTTWVGGFMGSNPTLPNATVTQITVPGVGQSKTGQDIHLSDGSSISGKLIGYVPDPDNPYVYVEACVVYSDGLNDCAYTQTVASDGSYTLQGLVPGVSTVVDAYARGYQTTWYGGYVGYAQSFPNPQITQFTSAAVGGNVPNINITLVKPVTITGSVLPSSVVSGNGGLYVYACPTYAQNGQTYYRTSVDEWCSGAWVSPDSTSYSLQVTPGVSYVLVAQADGYTDAWYGGYSGVSGITEADQSTPDRVLPSASTIQLVSGTAGQTLDGKDIQFGQAQTRPVTLTFVDTEFNKTVSSITAQEGDSVTLPTITQKDYLFMGWYTKEDGAGTQVTSPTTVTASTTLYAYWIDAPAAEVVKEIAKVQSTGGLARAANGNDPYTLITTLTDNDGNPMSGLSDHLMALPPANVSVSGFTDNGNGKYSMTASASVPGNYLIRVTLDGFEVPGSPIPVNFIGASIDEPVRTLGDLQSADGLGFLPFEEVDVVVHSDPINIGRITADADGRVPVSFTVPKGFDLGHHTVEFIGVTSGTATVSFSVATPTADSSQIQGQTGGTATTAQGHGSLLVLAGVLVVAGLLVQRFKPHTAKRG